MQSSSSNLIQLQPLKLCIHNHNTATKTITISRQCCRFSRRELAIATNSTLLFLFGEPLLGNSRARADEQILEKISQNDPEENSTKTDNFVGNPDNVNRIEPEESRTEIENPEKLDEMKQEETIMETENSASQSSSKRAFLEVAIDGESIGRIVIELYNDTVPVGSSRFSSLVSGKAGISYRRKEFVKITPKYVQHGGVRSYGVDAELANKTGASLGTDSLVDEWEKQHGRIKGTKNSAGSVGIIVRDPLKPPPKMKLVARKGKLEIDEEAVGKDPNGTEFVISVRDSPELDDSALVIGRVLEGMDVVERIAQVKTVKENTTAPYFRVAKLIGDKRAVVAERGFNRPYSKVQISNCGFIN